MTTMSDLELGHRRFKEDCHLWNFVGSKAWKVSENFVGGIQETDTKFSYISAKLFSY